MRSSCIIPDAMPSVLIKDTRRRYTERGGRGNVTMETETGWKQPPANKMLGVRRSQKQGTNSSQSL